MPVVTLKTTCASELAFCQVAKADAIALRSESVGKSFAFKKTVTTVGLLAVPLAQAAPWYLVVLARFHKEYLERLSIYRC